MGLVTMVEILKIKNGYVVRELNYAYQSPDTSKWIAIEGNSDGLAMRIGMAVLDIINPPIPTPPGVAVTSTADY